MQEELIFRKYGKMNLKLSELSEVIGVSPSKINKLFSEKGESYILKNNLLPVWKKVGTQRLWNIESIVNWNKTCQ